VNDHRNGVDLERNDAFLDRLRAGDRKAFAAFVEEHQDMIYNLVLRMVRDRELAQDLAQEVFLKAYRGLASFRGGSTLATWVYRIAYNTAVTELQRARYRYERTDLDDPETEMTADPVDPSADPLARLEQSDAAARLQELIGRLKPRQRTALLLHYQGGRTYEEIAEIMDIPMGTVKTALFRAKDTLRKLFPEGER
jgi:RNA polymerase sigma-70 factor (ECF subfamily)